MVRAGRFKRISASFYPPKAASNPAPGGYYLKHVGFLGAQPPAVKGLKAAEFAEDADAEKRRVAAIKDMGDAFLTDISEEQGREFAIARTKIEEAVMWAVKGLTR